jgi:hypothetical protein
MKGRGSKRPKRASNQWSARHAMEPNKGRYRDKNAKKRKKRTKKRMIG